MKYLQQQLPENYRTLNTALTALQANPRSVEAFARSVAPSDFTRDIVGVPLPRWRVRMRMPRGQCCLRWCVYSTFRRTNGRRWKRSLHSLMGSDASADDRRWRDGVIRRSHNAALLERRLRMALGRAIRYRCANGWGVYRSQCMIRMSGAIGMQWH